MSLDAGLEPIHREIMTWANHSRSLNPPSHPDSWLAASEIGKLEQEPQKHCVHCTARPGETILSPCENSLVPSCFDLTLQGKMASYGVIFPNVVGAAWRSFAPDELLSIPEFKSYEKELSRWKPEI